MNYKGYCLLKSDVDVFIAYDEQMDPEGYAKIKQEMMRKVLPIMDVCWLNDKIHGLLLIGPDGKCLLDVRDMKSVGNYFLCDFFGDVMLPTGLDTITKTIEAAKRISLGPDKYNCDIRKFITAHSLIKGVFDDSFIFK